MDCGPYTREQADRELAAERARRARLTATQRRREDLLDYRERVADPMRCPADLFTAINNASVVAAELARIDAQIAALDLETAA